VRDEVLEILHDASGPNRRRRVERRGIGDVVDLVAARQDGVGDGLRILRRPERAIDVAHDARIGALVARLHGAEQDRAALVGIERGTLRLAEESRSGIRKHGLRARTVQLGAHGGRRVSLHRPDQMIGAIAVDADCRLVEFLHRADAPAGGERGEHRGA
jgi:hypothetical protein